MSAWTRMPACAAAATLLLCLIATRSRSPSSGQPQHADVLDSDVRIDVDLAHGHPVSDTLFGIFFEEINHAGEGGLYAEMVQDRSFDALALTQQYDHSSAYSVVHDIAPTAFRQPSYGRRVQSHQPKLPRQWNSSLQTDGLDEVPVAWTPIGTDTKLSLVSDAPLDVTNPVALRISAGSDPGRSRSSSSSTVSGVANSGFWGISVQRQTAYHVSLYLKRASSSLSKVQVALQSGDLAYAQLQFANVTSEWHRFEGQLAVGNVSANPNVSLAVTFSGPGALLVDVVSLLPAENVARAAATGAMDPWPFRADLLQMLKDLQPRFIRFPGGCYVEGDTLAHAFRWKTAIGLSAERRGHWNLWGYWSTDGLGLFEYMQLAEELRAEPVWVINSGVAHADSIPTTDIQPWVQDALDSVEFVSGPADSRWGAVRAAMGHPEPWALNYLAIGNEDCGKPYYLENYIAFFEALRALHPQLRLVANCNMGDSAPTDLYDWHVYTDPASLFNLRTAFDELRPNRDAHIFASEYAVTSGGGTGNLIGAIAEAGFMTGLERNSQVVEMAAYAPLLVNTNSRGWPTNLIVFDNHRAYGIPSYHVQQLFAQHQGNWTVATSVMAQEPLPLVAASATCTTSACNHIAIKVVSIALVPHNLTVALQGLPAGVTAADGELTVLTGAGPLEENSFEQPLNVAPRRGTLQSIIGNRIQLQLPPLSLGILVIDVSPSAHGKASGWQLPQRQRTTA